jgi:hypothetical protein
MWSKIEAWAKAHPMALGITIFVVGAILIYLFTRGSSAPATTGTGRPSDAYYQAQAAIAASGNQLQAAQLASQAQSNYVGAQLQAAQDQIGGQVALAQIAAGQNTSIATLQADIAKTGIGATQESTDLASSLTASVQNAGINAQVAINAANNAAATTNTTTAANEQVAIAGTNAQLQESSIQAQLAGMQAGYDTQAAIAGLQAAVQQHQISTEGFVQQQQIATTGFVNQQLVAALTGSLPVGSVNPVPGTTP